MRFPNHNHVFCLLVCFKLCHHSEPNLFLSQERLQADEVIQALDTQSVWEQELNINPKDEL